MQNVSSKETVFLTLLLRIKNGSQSKSLIHKIKQSKKRFFAFFSNHFNFLYQLYFVLF